MRPDDAALPATLLAEDVTCRFGTVIAVDRVSLAVGPGECVALVGESGSGKSTLLQCFNGMVRPAAGRVLVDGVEVAAVEPTALRRRIGYVQQSGGLLPHWKVRRNAALVPWLRGESDADERADHALTLVGLPSAEFGDRWPRELSGGQRQRVAIARALAGAPRIVLLDEPFGALDAITRGELHELFLDFRRTLTLTMLFVTHDLQEAVLLADRVAVLRAGRIEQDAHADELRRAPATEYVRTLLTRAGVLS